MDSASSATDLALGDMAVAAMDSASSATDLALGDMAADITLGAIGVERYLRAIKHHQELWLVGAQALEQR